MSASDEAYAELLTALQNNTTRLTEMAGQLRGLTLNHVLIDELVTIGADGFVTREASTNFASVGLWSLGANAVTFTPAPPAERPPGAGVGVKILPAGSGLVWPAVGLVATLYGTAGDKVLLTLWSQPQPPMLVG